MTKTEALAAYSEACSVVEIGDTYVRDGNWTAVDRVLRHCADTSTVIDTAKTLNGDIVVKVEPSPNETSKGKSEMKLPPFLLVVK